MIPLAESDNRINQATQEWNYQECSKKHPLFCNQLVRSSSHTYRVDLLWCTSRMKWKPQTENSIITILLHSIQSASDKKSGNMRKKCRSGEVPPKKRERRALRTLPPNAKRNLVYSRERLSLHPSLRETQQIGRQMSGLQVTCQVTCSVLQHRKLWKPPNLWTLWISISVDIFGSKTLPLLALLSSVRGSSVAPTVQVLTLLCPHDPHARQSVRCSRLLSE